MLLGLLTGWGLLLPAAPGQETAGGIIYARYRQFRIPFQTGQGPRPKQLNLFVSTDQGRNWQASASAPPEQGYFGFSTDRDGYYWFAVQQVEADGRMFPPTMAGAQPSLKVVVDTQPPLIQVQPLPTRIGEVGVAWHIGDDNLDLALADALRLEYRPPGGQWLMLPVQPGATQYYWNPQSNGIIEVRLRARDRAGNWGEAATSVSLAGNLNPQIGNPNPQLFGGPGPGEVCRFVNSKRVTLNFDLREVGPSGISTLELWYTQDGRSWNKQPPRTGEEANQKALIVEVNGEGVYGFTLLAKSGVGLGLRPPQIGDRPQIWVEVDLTKPVVQLFNVIVGQGEDKGKLTVTWSARDKNLHKQPITIAYAEQTAGPWSPMVQNHANAGRYVWTMPERVPFQFFVKVSALDTAGNIGDAVTDQVVKVDLAQPKAKITDVSPAGP